MDARRIQIENNERKTIGVELASLNKQEVFGLIILTPPNVHIVEYRWVFFQRQILVAIKELDRETSLPFGDQYWRR